jgi:putative Holliday junction resolvase
LTPVLGVDWGTQRVGLAVSDATRQLARPLPTLTPADRGDAVRQIIHAARSEGAQIIVVGLPLSMNGGEGPAAKQARRLGSALEKEGFSVVYHDERMSSEEARELLWKKGDPRPAKARIDQVAALLLLQSYLDSTP